MVVKEYFNNKKGLKCSICKKQKAKLQVASNVTELVHGFYLILCKDCYITCLFNEKKKIEEELKQIKREK